MQNEKSSSLDGIIQSLQKNPSFRENITYLLERQPRKPVIEELPAMLHPSLRDSLARNGITGLYSHQLRSFELYQHHQNYVIATGTSSGKSLCYQLPILDTICHEENSTALLMFPTKALANDQLNAIRALVPEEISDSCRTAIYDGDTPQRERVAIREMANVILTNPDMLNIGILPNHPLWERFFENLKFVVIDEIHIYRGVFGSHVGNLMRRLQRITSFYGSTPLFIMTSATINNPQQLSEKLVEKDVVLINEDGSPQGKKYFLVYNPPLINDELGIREGLLTTTGKFLSLLYQQNIQTLVFCRTRRFVEILLRDVKDVLQIPGEKIRGYRSGYLKTERREIENGLKTGEIIIGIATNALELGVDIGGVDSVLLPGYPGTISALIQRAGRAGRKFNPSLAVFIASMNPLDQYLTRNPEYLMSRNPEEALINPDNPLILIEHLQCAVAEIPFDESDRFGKLESGEVREYLDYLTETGVLYKKNGRYHWVSDDYPTQHVSLRNTSSTSILLRNFQGGAVRVIGDVDYNSALWMVHAGAIYIHDGETYRVDDLDLENFVATLTSCEEDYLTEPVTSAEVEIVHVDKTSDLVNYRLNHGEVIIRTTVKGYKRIEWSTRETIDYTELDLPETMLRTVGFWVVLNKDCVEKMRNSGMWRSDRNDYGPDWNSIRNLVRQRDSYTCQACGKKESVGAHHVHHKIPFRLFNSLEKANELNNLVTLCADCHSLVESQVRVRSALSGLNHILESLAPLMVMCDASDLGSFFEPAAKFADNQPAIIFYDNIPAGIGLTDNLYDRFDDLLSKSAELVKDCDCADGCPSCVGPSLEGTTGGKLETLQLIKYLQEK